MVEGVSNNCFDLVIISDMVEECSDGPFGPISLNKPDPQNEIEFVRRNGKTASLPNLSDVRITMIVPISEDRPFDSNLRRTPSHFDLKEFWRLILRYCGFKEEWFWDTNHVQWVSNGELPERFKPRA
jgi:hypothetical protein